jgi:hypothetical protein
MESVAVGPNCESAPRTRALSQPARPQTRRVPSLEPETMRPSDSTVTAVTESECPSRVRIVSPFATPRGRRRRTARRERGGGRLQVVLAVDEVRRLAQGVQIVDHGDARRGELRRELAQERAPDDGREAPRAERAGDLRHIELGAGAVGERGVGEEDPQGASPWANARRRSAAGSRWRR